MHVSIWNKLTSFTKLRLDSGRRDKLLPLTLKAKLQSEGLCIGLVGVLKVSAVFLPSILFTVGSFNETCSPQRLFDFSRFNLWAGREKWNILDSGCSIWASGYGHMFINY